MDVDRALMHGAIRRTRIHGSEKTSRRLFHHSNWCAADAAQVGKVAGPLRTGPEPSALSASEQTSADQLLQQARSRRAEELEIGVGQRKLSRCGAQVRCEHVRVVRVQHRCFHWSPEQGVRVVDQVGVQRVVASDQHGQRVLTSTPRAPGLLPHGSSGSGPASHQDSVQPSHIYAELQRRSRGDAKELTRLKVCLQRSSLLRQVARAVSRNPSLQARLNRCQ